MIIEKCKSCDSCEKQLRLLRERCKSVGVEISYDEPTFWWYCFAVKAVYGIARAGDEESLAWLAARPVPPKKKKLDKLPGYVLSRFPSIEVRKRFKELAMGVFPEAFSDGDPEEIVKTIGETRRDPDAARFVLKALGREVALPDWFYEKCFRTRFEIILREYSINRALSDPNSAYVKEVVEKACASRDETIARYREKLERGSQMIAEKTAEAEYYRNLAEELLSKMQEMESFYRAEIEKLHARIKELERSAGRVEDNKDSSPSPAKFPVAKVLIIGDPSREGAYREALSFLGVEIKFIDGIDRSCDPSVARHVDLVIIVGDYGKHSVFEKVKPEAKKYGVPVVTVPSGGVSTVVNAVRTRLLEREGVACG
ncbi:MAG: DUF2325 domain-containing protein [Thermacetogeniaceae bacterium]